MFCASCGKEIPAGAAFCPNCGAPVQGVGGATGGTSAPVSGIDSLTKDQKAQEYWMERLFAIIIDFVIVYIVLGIITLLVAIPAYLTGGLGLFGAVFGGLALLWGLIFLLYNAVMETSSGASIGKMIIHLKVTSKAGANPNFGQAFIRNISKIYWLLLLLDVIVGLAITRDYHQKYSDHFIGTTVVKKQTFPSGSLEWGSLRGNLFTYDFKPGSLVDCRLHEGHRGHLPR
jgi:uncharacterized RDD family membrane protein YckC